MARRVRVGVVGCGLIAQVMHLPYLAELSDRFELAAVCDSSAGVASGCAGRYGAPRVHARWEDLVADELDAVMVLTSGDHAPIATGAAEAGLHVFVEKPMALCSRDAERTVLAAERSGTRLMVGTMKRYDPAYERLALLLGELEDLRLVRVTTLESPLGPYVAHHPLIRAEAGLAAQPAEALEAEASAIDAALGPDADEQMRWCYHRILLGSLIHEVNALRGLLGEPDEVRAADLGPRAVSVNLRFGEADCHLSWVDLPGIARYRQEFAFYGPDQRLTLELPSPFLRNTPSRLIVEGGRPGTTDSWRREDLVSYEEAFKRELIEFSECIGTGREPRTSGRDGLGDIRLCEAIAGVNRRRESPRGRSRASRSPPARA